MTHETFHGIERNFGRPVADDMARECVAANLANVRELAAKLYGRDEEDVPEDVEDEERRLWQDGEIDRGH